MSGVVGCVAWVEWWCCDGAVGGGDLSLSLSLSRAFSLSLWCFEESGFFSWLHSSGAVWVLRAGFLGSGVVGRCQNWSGVPI